MKLSSTEENYIKAIYHLSNAGEKAVSTNTIADELNTAAASVSDMIKKLANKKLINYKKYHGVNIDDNGKKVALSIIRKHRLWEVFLVDTLNFNWDQFLDYPKIDPHGDPIPDEEGNINVGPQFSLLELGLQEEAVITAVENSESLFLQHLDNLGLRLGVRFKIVERAEFDGSIMIQLEENKKIFLSKEVAKNLLVRNL